MKDWNHKYDYQAVMNLLHSYQKNYYVVKGRREVMRRLEEHDRPIREDIDFT